MCSIERDTSSSVLGRAVELLDAFSPDTVSLSLAELTRRSGLPKPTAYRLANQLVEFGLLERGGTTYRLGLRLFELGSAVSRQRRLRDAALPVMQDLYEATHETIHLGVLDGLEVLYIDKIAGKRATSVATRTGTRKPLHCTALGKVILAHSPPALLDAVLEAGLARHSPRSITDPAGLRAELANIADQGVAYDREEYSLGVTCVAAPLLDRDSGAQVAISITGPSARFDPTSRAPTVRMAALSLARTLHGLPWPA